MSDANVMVKDHHKCNFDKRSLIIFKLISGWAYVGLPKGNLWVTCKWTILKDVRSFRKIWHGSRMT